MPINYNQGFMFTVIRQLLAFLDHRSRRQFFLLSVPMLGIAFLEMVSIGMIVPVVQVVTNGNQAKILSFLPNALAAMETVDLILLAGGVFAAFFVLKNLVILAMIYLITFFTQRKLAQFSQRMFDLYLRRNYTFHLEKNSAEVIRNLSNSAGACFDGLRLFLTIVMDIFLTAAALILLLLVEPIITMVIGVILGLAAHVLYRVLSPLLNHWGAQVYSFEAKVIKSVSQGLGAIKDIKVLNCQPNIIHTFTGQTNSLAKYTARSITANQSPRLFIETLVVLTSVAVVLVLFQLNESIDQVVALVGLFGMAALRLMPSLNRILSSATEIRHRTAMVDSLHLDLTEGIREAEKKRQLDAGSPMPFTSEIKLENISYKYPESQAQVLNGVTLKVNKGMAVGLVGESGSGKTTTADIILGLLEPGAGRLSVDNEDAFENIRRWQSHLGYVPQSIYLLDDTLRRNIAFGVLDDRINDEALARSISMAQLNSVISELPDGVETVIGEQGVRLSGGQRQRVGIARALYRDPDVLVLDEATSSLDSQTEWEVSNAIDALAGQKTLIIIAHRLSTVAKCDQLVFLKEGRVVDVGSLNELNERCPEFERLVDLQMSAA